MYQTIRRGTDNTGVNVVPVRCHCLLSIYSNYPVTQNRYHSLREMIRQWQHLTLSKRAGIGHSMNGVADVRGGALALLCPACPQYGINTLTMSKKDKLRIPLPDVDFG